MCEALGVCLGASVFRSSLGILGYVSVIFYFSMCPGSSYLAHYLNIRHSCWVQHEMYRDFFVELLHVSEAYRWVSKAKSNELISVHGIYIVARNS